MLVVFSKISKKENELKLKEHDDNKTKLYEIKMNKPLFAVLNI